MADRQSASAHTTVLHKRCAAAKQCLSQGAAGAVAYLGSVVCKLLQAIIKVAGLFLTVSGHHPEVQNGLHPDSKIALGTWHSMHANMVLSSMQAQAWCAFTKHSMAWQLC